MADRPRIIFLVGGPDFHPARRQSDTIRQWLGEAYLYHAADSLAAFEHLGECDLLVLLGMHWSGWEGRYRSPTETHRRNLEKYVQSGKPILAANGAVASYDDWPRFGELVGFSITSPSTAHTPVQPQAIHLISTRHPIIDGLSDYTLVDEFYLNLTFTPGLDVQVHAQTQTSGRRLPIIVTAEGGRIEGTGKTAYLANGHDMQAFASPQLKRLWINAVQWCLRQNS